MASRPGESRDSADVQIVENARPSRARMWTVDDSAVLSIGHQHAQPEYELFRVTGALRLSDGTLAIANSGTSEIRWYSASGAFLRSSGRQGNGPGEFQQLIGLLPLEDDSVGAGDYALQRMSVYDATGTFVRTVSQHAVERQILSPIARFADGTLLWATSGFVLAGEGPTRIERLSMNVYRLNATGGSAEFVGALPWLEQVVGPSGGVRPDGSDAIGRNPRVFGRSSWLVADAQGWLFADNAAPQIEVHAINGALTRIIRWDASPRPVTEEDVQRDLEWTLARSNRQEPAVQERIRRAREAHPAPPDTMPWFGCSGIPCPGRSLLLDTDRNLWVQEYRPPAEGLSDRYQVFDSAGIWLGAVTMPTGLEVLSIGSDYVVGRVRDELDVESVVVHRIEKR
ncbi:MAG: hypothetical protein AB7T31_03285 [Gemmatimonadales bacterium]